MDYTQLTAAQRTDIYRQKLLEIEAEHARLDLDLELAHGVGLETDQVKAGRANLALLERQHGDLLRMMAPPPVPSDNGAAAPAQGALAVRQTQ